MATSAQRRSAMTLYSDPTCPISHSVRIVVAEKDINVDVISVTGDERPDDLRDLNPYNRILTLIDRQLVLYDAQVIMEYLDERFPHPPLMPVDPVLRATNRQLRFRIARDLYDLIDDIQGDNDIAAATARRAMRDHLTAVAPALGQKPYFLSEEFTLADCYLLPILWRLNNYGIKLPPQGKALAQYSQRLFTRPAFLASLSDIEQEWGGIKPRPRTTPIGRRG
jgi:RNA polymerase-associated protein